MNAYRAEIDGLRALAIVAVVGFHTGVPGCGGGFAGVDVFYVVSGYLITRLLAGELLAAGSIDIAAFYARRVRRLLPALALVVIATLALGSLTLHPFGEQQGLARSAISTALLSSNVFFWRTTGGYFDRDMTLRPLLHTWSLAVEEQFYVVWPLLLWVLHRGAGRLRLPFQPVVSAALVVLAPVSLWLTTVLAPGAAFYLLPARGWELALGALLALRPCGAWQPGPRLAATLGLAGIAGLGASMSLFDADSPWPGLRTLLPTLGTAGVIAAGPASDSPAVRLLASPPLVYVGRLSYSWYLWHWPLLALLRASTLSAVRPAAAGALALAALALAAVTYHTIENPVRRRKLAGFRSDRATLASGAALLAAVLFAAAALGLSARHAAAGQPGVYREMLDARREYPLTRSCTQHLAFPGLRPEAACMLGEAGGPVRLLLWGDSHADQFGATLQSYARASHSRVLERSFGNCPPLLAYRSPLLGARAGECERFNAAVAAELPALKAQGLQGVVLAARWLMYAGIPVLNLADQPRDTLDFRGIGRAPAYRTLEQSLVHTIAAMQASGVKVLLIAPVPEMLFDTPDCFARHPHELLRCAMPRAAVDANRDAFVRELEALAGGSAGVRLWDPIADFCDEHWCYAARGAELVFRDGDHISLAASRELYPSVAPALEWAAGSTTAAPAPARPEAGGG